MKRLFFLAATDQAKAWILSGSINTSQKPSKVALVISIDRRCLWALLLIFRLFALKDFICILNLYFWYTKVPISFQWLVLIVLSSISKRSMHTQHHASAVAAFFYDVGVCVGGGVNTI